MVRVRIWGIALLAVLVAATPARGQTTEAAPVSLTLAQPEALPFSEEELRQALLARLPAPADGAGVPAAAVGPAGPDAVTIQVGDRGRIIVVGGRTGAAAARVVALAIADLLSADAQPEGAAPAAAEAPAATTAAEAPAVVATGVAAPSTSPPSIAASAPTPAREAQPGWMPRLCVTAGAAKGTNANELWAGTVNADLVMPWGPGRLRFAPSAGLTVVPTHEAGTADEASFVGVALRALVGPSLGLVDVLGGALVTPYRIGGALPHAGVLVGGEAMARVAVPIWDRLRLVADGRVDAFANRVQVVFVGGQTFATPRVGLGAGLGLAWDWTP